VVVERIPVRIEDGAMIRTCGCWALGEVTWRGAPSEDDLEVIEVLIRAGVGASAREGTPMLKVVHDGSEPNATSGSAVSSSLLDAIVRDGARQMLAAALTAEVAAYIEAHSGEVDVNGHRLVVRNGYHASGR
jgi:hypothetical protein